MKTNNFKFHQQIFKCLIKSYRILCLKSLLEIICLIHFLGVVRRSFPQFFLQTIRQFFKIICQIFFSCFSLIFFLYIINIFCNFLILSFEIIYHFFKIFYLFDQIIHFLSVHNDWFYIFN